MQLQLVLKKAQLKKNHIFFKVHFLFFPLKKQNSLESKITHLPL